MGNDMLDDRSSTYSVSLVIKERIFICLNVPADSPQMVTLVGSLPNLLIYKTTKEELKKKNKTTYMRLNPLQSKFLVH